MLCGFLSHSSQCTFPSTSWLSPVGFIMESNQYGGIHELETLSLGRLFSFGDFSLIQFFVTTAKVLLQVVSKFPLSKEIIKLFRLNFSSLEQRDVTYYKLLSASSSLHKSVCWIYLFKAKNWSQSCWPPIHFITQINTQWSCIKVTAFLTEYVNVSYSEGYCTVCVSKWRLKRISDSQLFSFPPPF